MPSSNNSKEVEIRNNLSELNNLFKPLSHKERISKLYESFDPEGILMTSSFGTHSVLILHLVNQINALQKIHFINTGFLFNETLAYKNELQKIYNLNIIEISPHKTEHELTSQEKWWNNHPRMCCTINKIAPLEKIVKEHEIWISGLMSFQNEWRSNLKIFEMKGDIIKFNPLIDLNEEEYRRLRTEHELLDHPLEVVGYGSVGCTHCTTKGEGRSGRWTASDKTECGIHQNYFYK